MKYENEKERLLEQVTQVIKEAGKKHLLPLKGTLAGKIITYYKNKIDDGELTQENFNYQKILVRVDKHILAYKERIISEVINKVDPKIAK